MHVNRSEFTERRNNTVPVKMEIKFLKREVTETLGLCKTEILYYQERTVLRKHS